jgi:hypothetical protein
MKWILIGTALFFIINMVSDSIAEASIKGEKITAAKVIAAILVNALIWPYALIRMIWYWISPRNIKKT